MVLLLHCPSLGFGSPSSLSCRSTMLSTGRLYPTLGVSLLSKMEIQNHPDGIFQQAFPADPHNLFRYSRYERRRLKRPELSCFGSHGTITKSIIDLTCLGLIAQVAVRMRSLRREEGRKSYGAVSSDLFKNKFFGFPINLEKPK